MQGDYWLIIAKFRLEMYFADPLGSGKACFLYRKDNQMMPAQLQSDPSVFDFYTFYAALNLFKFCKREITGVEDFNLLSFLGK